MSAYLVENDCINRAVSLMKQSNESCEDGDILGRRCQRLNYHALNARYGSPIPQDDELDFRYSPWFPDTREKTIQALKSLQCLIYQRSEGDICESSSNLYALMIETVNRVCREIVEDLPEYDAAKWG